MKTIKYPYNEYKKDLNSLVKQIQKKKVKYDLVLGVERGGLIPAVHLSHRLGIPFKTLSWSSQLKDGSMLTWFILRNKKILLVDDIVDSGGTLCNAAETLIESGAITVDAYVTHGVLSGGAVARVASSPLNSLVTTDSIAATEAFRVAKNVRHISIAPLLGEAVKRIHMERSVSSLFD